MRVIAGKYKGRQLKYPKSKDIRPLQDRAKEALFQILDVEDKDVLDIYAGSGQLGIEALSRGARSVLFVDIDKNAVKIIKNNLKIIHMDSSEKIFAGAAESFVKKNSEQFDVIIANPPFPKIDTKIIEQLFYSLKPEGVFVFIHPSKQKPESYKLDAKIIDSRQYGDTAITFLGKDPRFRGDDNMP